MLSRLYEKLDRFLIEFHISSDSDIFEKMLPELSELKSQLGETETSDYNTRFSISSSYRSDDKLKLSTPSLSLDELNVVCNFFKIPITSYRTGKELTLNADVLFDEILPKFENHIRKLHEEDPDKLKPYQVASKPKLENNAIDKIKTITHKFLKKLNQDEVVPQQYQDISMLLFPLEGIFFEIRKDSKYYFYINKIYENFDKLFKDDLELKKYLGEDEVDTLLQQLAIYIKYNRAESVLCVARFMKKLDEFLYPFGIDKSKCEVLENTLFEMAGLLHFPSRSRYDKSRHDETKINFKMLGITDEEANQFLAWIKSKGDDSAKLSSYEIEINDTLQSDGERAQRCEIREKPIYVTEYSFLIDGEVMYKNIFPLFMEKFKIISDEDKIKLTSYQNLSKNSEKFKTMTDKVIFPENSDIEKSNNMGMLMFSSPPVENQIQETVTTTPKLPVVLGAGKF